MAQPFKSQLVPTALLNANATIVLASLTLTGYLLSRTDQILEFFARLDIDLCNLATQSIQQFIQY